MAGEEGAIPAPAAYQYVVLIVLTCLSGMFSGLNLGLMSLTVEDLNIIISSSSDAQQVKFAERILPLRKRSDPVDSLEPHRTTVSACGCLLRWLSGQGQHAVVHPFDRQHRGECNAFCPDGSDLDVHLWVGHCWSLTQPSTTLGAYRHLWRDHSAVSMLAPCSPDRGAHPANHVLLRTSHGYSRISDFGHP